MHKHTTLPLIFFSTLCPTWSFVICQFVVILFYFTLLFSFIHIIILTLSYSPTLSNSLLYLRAINIMSERISLGIMLYYVCTLASKRLFDVLGRAVKSKTTDLKKLKLLIKRTFFFKFKKNIIFFFVISKNVTLSNNASLFVSMLSKFELIISKVTFFPVRAMCEIVRIVSQWKKWKNKRKICYIYTYINIYKEKIAMYSKVKAWRLLKRFRTFWVDCLQGRRGLWSLW